MKDPVNIVTIKAKIPLFKDKEEANSIELLQLEEAGFELVSRKDLHNVGDKVVLICPDYCLPDTKLFEDFIRPNGESKKSMLGSNNRIRAKKFNLHRGDNEVVYSNGILLSVSEVSEFLGKKDLNKLDLTKALDITKYEAPEDRSGGLNQGATRPFPEGIYKTDEPNLLTVCNKIQFPIFLIGTEKIDGSSITIGIKDGEGFVCSRNMMKPFSYMKVVGHRKPTIWERILKFFGKKVDLLIREETDNSHDDFVKYGKPYLDKLKERGYNNIVLRGELNGGSCKGSGNKNNPASKQPTNIKLFGIDYIHKGIAYKSLYGHYLEISTLLKMPICEKIFAKEFNSTQEIIDECNKHFKDNIIEGIVLRDPLCKFSAKFMNLEYDSKK